ncbi:MAG: hypothetical protein MSH30_03180 [Campylobacter sp.]|uniref:formyltransferase family protein n=1 Tax=Campylobacter sp. TaxID=205 RepID=UPI002AA81565|nr:formyltransferase family protein [Campylobacter sp.]MCI6344288.1 hypothetical protein [Campylobacter sp.]MCI7362316.1 hypothetical protein [Campylobacter sp.]
MSVKKIAILFSGSGSNMEAIIRKVHGKKAGQNRIEVALLICNKKDAYGIERAKNLGFETMIIEHSKYASREAFDSELVRAIKAANIDLVVLAGFMRVLGSAKLAKGGSGDVLSGMILALLAQGYDPLLASITATLAQAKIAANYNGSAFSYTPKDMIKGIKCL